ncbi:hypothetical protein [Xanthomonas campestris]|jgi:hypothetical protein|uniref:hypothetical protein n=1 Tax=Xanthomonas campestris TaxID=339 RepID=UPI001E63BAAE|nr:hypothetical protein [Xanthomonas campestris]MCC5085063.1 hypothetical protein [Xanthomonas campestris]
MGGRLEGKECRAVVANRIGAYRSGAAAACRSDVGQMSSWQTTPPLRADDMSPTSACHGQCRPLDARCHPMPANLAPPPCPDTAILQLAGLLVPAHEASRWFHHDPIHELGGWTAAQLSRMQRQPQVIAFLQSVLCGERG